MRAWKLFLGGAVGVLLMASGRAQNGDVSLRVAVCDDPPVAGMPGVEARADGAMSIGAGGHVVGIVELRGGGVTSSDDGAIVVVDPEGVVSLAVREGDVFGGGRFTQANGAVVDRSGRVAMRANLQGLPVGFDAILAGEPGSVSAVALPGEDVSGEFGAGAFLDSFTAPVMNPNGVMAFDAVVRGSGPTYRAVYVSQGGGKTMVLRSGENYPGLPGGETTVFENSSFRGILINDSGDLLFQGRVDDDEGEIGPREEIGVFRFSGGTVSEVLRAGDVLGGFEVGGVDAPESFAGNFMALKVGLEGDGVTSADDTSYWVGSGGSFFLAVREGDSAPVEVGVVGGQFTDDVDIAVAADGTAVVRATLSSGTRGIWMWSGGLSYVAAVGGDVPGVAGSVWTGVGTAGISPDGRIGFTGLHRETFAESNIWVVDGSGEPVRVLARGDVLPLADGGQRTARETAILADFGELRNGADGRAAAMSAGGQVLVDFSFACVAVLELGAPVSPGRVEGQVRLDVDGDGDLGDADGGIEGVVVQLVPSGGGDAEETVTDSGGRYVFGQVVPGNYTVVAAAPGGFRSTGDADGGEAGSISVAVLEGAVLDGRDFLQERIPVGGELVVRVVEDPNGDGDGADAVAGVEGVRVFVFNDFGELVSESTTGADGRTVVAGLADGDYQVGAKIDTRTSDFDWVNPTLERYGRFSITEIAMPHDGELLLPGFRRGSVSGVVLDADRPGFGLGGARVRLVKPGGEVVRSVVTEGHGGFSFRVPPGDYVLEEIDPASYRSVRDSGLPADANRIAVALASGEDSPGHEFVDERADFAVSLHRLALDGVANPNRELPERGPLPAIDALVPVADTVLLGGQPSVDEGLVADGVTPLLLRVSVPGLSEVGSFRWDCREVAGGSLVGGVYPRMRSLVGGQWVEPGGAVRRVEVDPGSGFGFVYLGALRPELLDFAEGSKEIELEFRLLSDDGEERELASGMFGLRLPPVLLLHDSFGEPWGADFLDEVKARRAADFVFASNEESRLLVGSIDNPLFGGLSERWAVTRYDLVAHGARFTTRRSSFYRSGSRDGGNLFRGKFRRAVSVGAPHNGSRLTPYVKALDERLAEIDATGAVFGYLPHQTLRIDSWDQLQKEDFGGDFAPRDLDPRSIYYERERVYDRWMRTFHVVTTIDAPRSEALRRIGLFDEVGGQEVHRLVFPDGSDGVVDTGSMRAARLGSGNTGYDPRQSIAHGPPSDLYGGADSQTTSRWLGEFVMSKLDATEPFRALVHPKPKRKFDLFAIVEAAQDVPAANVVDIVAAAGGRAKGKGKGGAKSVGVQVFEYELDVPAGQPVVGDVFWSVELHGAGGVTTDGVSVSGGAGNSAVVSVEPFLVGDVVLYASYETTGGKIAFGRPVLVTSKEPLGAVLEGIEILPSEITLPVGEVIRPDVVAVYDDGTRVTKWVTAGDLGAVTSSASGVVSVADVPRWEAVSAGVATLTVEAFGMSAQSVVTVEAGAPARTFAEWKADVFTAGELGDPLVSGEGLDLDGDGLDLYFEYLTGGRPFEPNAGYLPGVDRIVVGGLERDAVRMRVSRLLSGERVVVESSVDLETWVEVMELSGEPDLSHAAVLDVIEAEGFLEVYLDPAFGAGQYFRLSAGNGGSGVLPVTGTSVLSFEFGGSYHASYGVRVQGRSEGNFAYGGEGGYTPNVDLYYGGNPIRWASGYGDLTDVLYSTTGILEINFRADNGYLVSLESFDLAGYNPAFSADPAVDLVEVLDGSGAVRFSATDVVVSETGRTTFDFGGVAIEGADLTVRFDANNLGGNRDEIAMDNVRFSQRPTGEAFGDSSQLTFRIDGKVNSSDIDQGYGDRVSGVRDGAFHYGGTGARTPNVVVDYGPVGADPALWDAGYGGLRWVLFKDADFFETMEVRLTADAGYEVVLHSFEMAAYAPTFPVSPQVRSVSVLDESGAELFVENDATVLSGGRTRYDFSGTVLRGAEIVIRYDAGNLGSGSDDVAIDNIHFGQVRLP